jgi:hypothetical protein
MDKFFQALPRRRTGGGPGTRRRHRPPGTLVLPGPTLPHPAVRKAAATVRNHHDGIVAAIKHGLANGRHEGLNN